MENLKTHISPPKTANPQIAGVFVGGTLCALAHEMPDRILLYAGFGRASVYIDAGKAECFVQQSTKKVRRNHPLEKFEPLTLQLQEKSFRI